MSFFTFYHVFLNFARIAYFYFIWVLFLWEESHAYNNGKALVFSKAPLPDYRADLDERHGSAQKEVSFVS